MIPFQTVLFVLCLFLPYLTGAGWLNLRVNKERISPGQSYLMGLLTIFAIAQAVSFISIKGRFSFDRYCLLLIAAVLAVTLISLIIGRKALALAFQNDDSVMRGFRHLKFGRAKKPADNQSNVVIAMEKNELHRIRTETIVITLVIILQCLAYFIYVPDTGSSTMAETITVTTATNTIFSYNPVTGALMERGIYPIYKLASLPLFYSALYRLSGLSLPLFLYIVIPIWVTLSGLSVVILWGEVLSRGMRERRALFLMFYSIMILLRGGVRGTYAYVVMHEAFKGKGLVLELLLPLFLCGVYLILFQKERLFGGAIAALSISGMVFCLPLQWRLKPSDFTGGRNTEWTILFLAAVIIFILWDRARIQWHKRDLVLLSAVLLISVVPGSAVSYGGIAFCLTRICDMAREWGHRRAVYIGGIIIICLYGTVLPMRSPQITRWEVPGEYRDAIRDIESAGRELCGERPGSEPVVLAQSNIMELSRIRGTNTRLLYGKDLWYENCNTEVADEYSPEIYELYDLMAVDYIERDKVAEKAASLGVNILLLREYMEEETRLRTGFEEPIEGPGYALYVRREGL